MCAQVSCAGLQGRDRSKELAAAEERVCRMWL